jgi:hypothetical protein
MLIEPNGVEVQAYTGHPSTFSLTLVSPLQAVAWSISQR